VSELPAESSRLLLASNSVSLQLTPFRGSHSGTKFPEGFPRIAEPPSDLSFLSRLPLRHVPIFRHSRVGERFRTRCKEFSCIGLHRFLIDVQLVWIETPHTVEIRWKSCDFSGLTAIPGANSFKRFRGRLNPARDLGGLKAHRSGGKVGPPTSPVLAWWGTQSDSVFDKRLNVPVVRIKRLGEGFGFQSGGYGNVRAKSLNVLTRWTFVSADGGCRSTQIDSGFK